MNTFVCVWQYMSRWLRVAGQCVLLAIMTVSTVAQARAQAPATGTSPTLWFSAITEIPAPAGFQVDQDYPQLFEPGAPWQHALSRVQVFQMTRRDVMSRPDEKLQIAFAFLRQHRIALAVTFGMIPDNNCGEGVEGMVHNSNANLVTAQRIKKLGGDLQYINVDEPLFFGHYFTGQNRKRGCRYPMEELVAGYASEIRKVRSVFPDARVVEDEPVEGLESASDLGRWIDLLKHELGEGAPRAIRLDVQWASSKRPWRTAAQSLVTAIKRKGLGYGVIFDGTPEDRTNEDWIRTAQANIRAWEATIQAIPDDVMIQSWHRHPEKLLPETSPTLPYLVNWYCENARMARRDR